MKYLVLGSAGQIGAPLCEFLRSKGHQVLEVDIVKNPDHDDLRSIGGALYDPESWATKIPESDFVFFLAFDVGGSRYLNEYQHSYQFLHNNMKIMSNVFAALRHFEKPFIFASSQMANMSHSPYGVAKLLGETYTKSLGGITTKFWNVYGPELNVEKSHVITDFILMARDKGEIVMKTTGKEERQFLYVEDCCKCLYELSQGYDTVPRDKNLHVASFEWVKVVDVAKLVLKEMNLKSYNLYHVDQVDQVQLGIKNEPDPYIVKYWRPETLLENGIAKMVEFYTVGNGKNVKLEK